ncbi:cobalt-zinc-cadmium efflux system outer membrane protein [Salinibacter ruber]|uniref:TolC family protein n=1 Tax=Salinibacter ruber TaxID=146919 RepID=UPI0021689315|nr:TolC family protein [Salinibacter ruber]MCS3937261.1 cobalt-zinc-cadmium efflux system outer membrane protein [Salinibacter ruber]
MRTPPVYVYPLCIAFLLIGCRSTRPDPEPRPLGSDVPAYEAPRDGPEQPAGSDVRRPPEWQNAPGDTLTLQEGLALALANNPRLQSFSWEVRAREAQALQAGLWPNPVLGTETEDLSTNDPVGDFIDSEQMVQVSQPIELWGRPGKRRDVAETERDLAGWDYEAARLDVVSQTTQAFVRLVAAEERVQLAQKLVRLSEEVFQTVKRQVETGKVTPVEKQRARVPLSQARIRLRRAEEARAAARKTLSGQWGRSDTTAFMEVEGTFGPVRSVPPLDTVQAALDRNPALARQEDEIERARAILGLEKRDRFPVPSVKAGWQRFGGRTGSDQTAFKAGIALPLPLFDRNQGAVQRARYRLEQARRQREAARVRLDTTLATAYRSLASSQSEAQTIADETLPAAQSAFESVRQGYRQGKFDYLEVLDAQRTLFGVRRQQIQALRRYYRARVRVERLVATPLEELQ